MWRRLLDGARRRVGLGIPVPTNVLAVWRLHGKEQVVGQAEVLPICWPSGLGLRTHKASQAFTFVDNDSARYATVAMFSPVGDAMLMWSA
jgi:hypothetical protein